MSKIITCENCDKRGEIDSGAPDPQGHFISITCPTCLGFKNFDLSKFKLTEPCCGLDFYQGSDLSLAYDEDWDILIMVSTDPAESLCWHLRDVYC